MRFPHDAFHIHRRLLVKVTGYAMVGMMRCELPDGTYEDMHEAALMDPKDVHCCPKCGDTDIVYPVWQDPNSGVVGSWIEGSEGHCRACEAMFCPTSTTNLATFNNSKS